jgi:serine/threonine-protein kinase RsbW
MRKETRIFPGKFESLPKIRSFVVQAAKKAGFVEADIYAVELAVDEACSNIIEHAYGAEGVGDIKCTYWITDKELEIVITDKGRPVEPESIPEPDFSVPLDQLKTGGAGLFLMRKMMDDVRFEFTPDQGNRLILVKHRNSRQ